MILGSGLLQSGKTTLTLYTTKSGTFNPTIVASDTSGIVWTWPDGSTYTGGTPSKTLAGGTQTIRVAFADPTLITQLNFQAQNLTGAWPISVLAPFTALSWFITFGNAALNVSGNIADLPSTMTRLHCGATSSTLTGSIADLPSTMTQLHCYSTSSTLTGSIADLPSTMTQLTCDSTSSTLTGSIADLPSTMTQLQCPSTSSTLTGSIADLPSTMTTLHCHSTSSNITGGGTAMTAVGIRAIRLDSTSTTQANIDNILLRLYTDRASFAYATPVLNVGGTNPNPTGTYADATPPTTGLEYAYKLVNDPDTEGFNTWTITY